MAGRSHAGTYRTLLRLYPADFRTRYADDLVQLFGDLASERGRPAAWARTLLDLAVTVPRSRLEQIMHERHSPAFLNVGIAMLAIGGLVSVMVGLYPGVVLLAIAVVVALANRSQLASALRATSPRRRRQRLLTAAALGVVSVGSYMAFLALIGEHWSVRETVLASIGVPAMLGSMGFLVAGLLTPRPRPAEAADIRMP